MSETDNETDNADEPTTAEPTAGKVVALGWDQQGNPILFPSSAVGFRVRRFAPGARGGAPEVVYREGIPLLLDLDTSVEELRETTAGLGGRYRLEAVDDCAQLVADVPHAYVYLTGPASQQPASTPDAMSRVLDSVERLARTNADSIEKLTSQMGNVLEASSRLVTAADSAGISRREPAPAPPVQVLAPLMQADEPAMMVPPDGSGSAAFWKAFADGLAPQLPGLLAGLAQLLKTKVQSPGGDNSGPASGQGGA